MARTAVLLVTLWSLAMSSAVAAVSPPAPKIDARAHLLVDFNSGRILAEANADERLEPASLTKMMTTYVVFAELTENKIELADEVRVSEKAWRMPGSRMFIEVGDRVKLSDLLDGLIVQSGNDASVALAEHVAGDESAFASVMNEYAQRIGMTGSHFVNASGLPDSEHYTTARDMALLASALIRDFPELYKLHALKEFTFNGITQRNRNTLLWRDESVDGLKTGYTRSAGYCLVASARREDMRLVSVVMGAESVKARLRLSETLLKYGFRFHETHRLYAAGETVQEVRIWRGERETTGMGVLSDVYITVPRGSYDKLKAELEIDSQIMAPVRSSERFGLIRVSLEGEQLVEVPLVALEAVAEGGIVRRLTDSVRLWLE